MLVVGFQIKLSTRLREAEIRMKDGGGDSPLLYGEGRNGLGFCYFVIMV